MKWKMAKTSNNVLPGKQKERKNQEELETRYKDPIRKGQ